MSHALIHLVLYLNSYPHRAVARVFARITTLQLGFRGQMYGFTLRAFKSVVFVLSSAATIL